VRLSWSAPGRAVLRYSVRFDARSSSPSHRVWGSRSGGVPRESLDAPEDLPKQAPCQVALGQLWSSAQFKDVIPGVPCSVPGASPRPGRRCCCIWRPARTSQPNGRRRWPFAVKDTEREIPMGLRCLALSAVLVCANLPAGAFAQSTSCPGIHVQILNIRNSAGTIDCALFDSPVGFPVEVLRSATNVMVMKVRNTQARCDFEDIPPGTYALAVIHDENSNGKLDTNWLGLPTEGYGFSKAAKGLLGAPSFSAASFRYEGHTLHLTISLHY
jgi:uncharacterized protein (DUF2141 family)